MSSAFTSERAFLAFDSLLQSKANTASDAQGNEWRESFDEDKIESSIVDSGFTLGRLPDSWSFAELNDHGQDTASSKDSVAESSTGIKPESAYVWVSRSILSLRNTVLISPSI